MRYEFNNNNSHKNYFRHIDVAVVVIHGYFDTYSNVYLLDFLFHIDFLRSHPDTYEIEESRSERRVTFFYISMSKKNKIQKKCV